MQQTIGVRTHIEVVEALRKLAQKQGRTLSNMAGYILTEYVIDAGLVKRQRLVVTEDLKTGETEVK